MEAATEEEHTPTSTSRYCPLTGIYRSPFRLGRRRIPADPNLDVATFVLSQLPPPTHLAASKPALIDSATGRPLTYSHLRRSALSLAAALHHGLGIRKGDVVLLLSPNSILYSPICLGVLAAGAVLATANPLQAAAEIAEQARGSGAKLAIAAPEEAHRLEAAGIPTLITTRQAAAGRLSAEELMEEADPADAPAAAASTQSEVAVLASGVALTHANLIAAITLLRWGLAATSSADDDVFLGGLPMFDASGLAVFVLGLPCAGSTTVVMPGQPGSADLGAMMEAVERHGVSSALVAPPVLLAMTKGVKARGCRWDLSSLRRVTTAGGAPMAMAAQVGKEFRRRFPWVELREVYGTTQVCGPATLINDVREREGSVGQLLPGFEARVVNEVGEGRVAAPPGGVGELWLRSPTTLMKDCKLGNEEDGWLPTGDLAFFDQDGYLYIVDRINDLINCNGYQITPADLEAILVGHPQIVDAAVIPVEDGTVGQIPMAYVVRSAESMLTSEEIIQFVASQVAPYKKIEKVAFVNAIPRTAAGKISKKGMVAQSQQPKPSKL